MTYNLFPFVFIISSSLNSILFVCNSFSQKLPMISSSFTSLIMYVHGNIFLTFLITKTYSLQFGVYTLAKMFLYFETLT